MADTTATVTEGPYVGPYPILEGQPFFGREIEVLNLADLLIARRIVLLHSPSGAGKTSLIHAGLIPHLRKRFTILPPMRVNRSLPGNLSPNKDSIHNCYLFSALSSLNDDKYLPEDQRLSLKELAHMDFLTYLQGRWRDREDPILLIFDQFEEFMTLDPGDIEGKRIFLSHLAGAMKNYGYWFLFVLRDDYVGGLEPYLSYFPDRLPSRYRLGFLGEQAALDAIKKPAAGYEVTFEDDAADELVNDLRKIIVQDIHGTREETGPHIEPIQLQVVCFQLWENLKHKKPRSITIQDIREMGNVDQALAAFYERALRKAAFQTDLSEGELRNWFEKRLITPGGTRNTVYFGEREGKTGELPNEVVKVLESQYVIRSEWRAGARWYELTHDRLIVPIQKSNLAWKKWNLARTRPLRPGFSVSGVKFSGSTIGAFALAENNMIYLLIPAVQLGAPDCRSNVPVIQPSQADGGKVPEDLISADSRCLPIEDGLSISHLIGLARLEANLDFDASIPGIGPVRGIREPVVGESVRMLGSTSGPVNGKILGVGTTVNVGLSKRVKFTQAIVTSLVSEAADEGAIVLDEDAYAVGILVGRSSEGSVLAPIKEILAGLNVRLFYQGAQMAVLQSGGKTLTATSWSPDGTRLASGSSDGTVILWNSEHAQPELLLKGHADRVTSVIWSPDGTRIASASLDGAIILWDAKVGQPDLFLGRYPDRITSVVWSSKEPVLASGSLDGKIILWDLSAGQAELTLNGHEDAVTSVDLSKNGQLASASLDGTVNLWNLERGQPDLTLRGHRRGVTNVAWSLDGSKLASGSEDGKVIIWDLKKGQPNLNLQGHSGPVTSLAWSPGGTRLAAGSWNMTVILWELESQATLSLRGHTGAVTGVTWSPDGTRLASGSRDATVRIWWVR